MGLTLLSGNALRVGPAKPGRRHFGVPNGGPFDAFSYAVAANLAGHDVWEVAPGRTSFRAETGCRVAVVRPESATSADGPYLSRLRTDETLLISVGWGEGAVGARAYVTSWPGEEIPRTRLALPATGHGPLRAVAFANPVPIQNRRVLPQSDRRGVRLSSDGNPTPADGRPSQPTFFGQIQQTPDGGVIILGPDGPTVGGYPSPGWVIRADLDRVGQLLPGDAVSIEWISRQTAMDLWRARQDRIRRFLQELSVIGLG